MTGELKFVALICGKKEASYPRYRRQPITGKDIKFPPVSDDCLVTGVGFSRTEDGAIEGQQVLEKIGWRGDSVTVSMKNKTTAAPSATSVNGPDSSGSRQALNGAKPMPTLTEIAQAQKDKEAALEPATLRDQFAVAALHGLVANNPMVSSNESEIAEAIAVVAYTIADVMLEARKLTKPTIDWPSKQAGLERLAAERLRAREIAERLGVTANMVIGRASRTGVKLLDRVEAIRMTKAEQRKQANSSS
jgi:hypothetical protein